MIDRARRMGRKTGLDLMLGSAALDLLRQAGETLAGRVTDLELTPFHVGESGVDARGGLWLRGGFPECFPAESDARSQRWRQDFI